jgi:hypothetical protein
MTGNGKPGGRPVGRNRLCGAGEAWPGLEVRRQAKIKAKWSYTHNFRATGDRASEWETIHACL